VLIVLKNELSRHAEQLARVAGVEVEIEEEGVQRFVLLRALPLPPGAYRVARTDALFITDVQYPLSAMDMFWTDPAVVLPDGSDPAGTESIESYRGHRWRRFSWHRNGLWNPRGNPLLDHFEFMQARFAKDVPQ
jgi:E2/UBC family protein E